MAYHQSNLETTSKLDLSWVFSIVTTPEVDAGPDGEVIKVVG